MDQNLFTSIATTRDGRDITRGWVDGLRLLIPQDPVRHARGHAWPGLSLDLYEETLRDDQVAATLQQRRLSVTSKPWEVTPGEDSRAGRKAADLLTTTLKKLQWDNITDKMLYARFFGFAVAECIWQRQEEKVILADLRVRDQRRFGYDPEMALKLLTFANPLGEDLPERKFWHFSCGSWHHDEPYGLGLAYWLYWPVYIKRNGIRSWLTFLDKFGMPTAKGTFPTGAGEVEKARLMAALTAIQSETGIILPEGYNVELIEAARGGRDSYEALQNSMNKAIAKVVLSQTMTTEDGSSLSQATVHLGVRDGLTDADADMIDDSFNQTIPVWLTDFNFPGTAPPTVTRIMDEPEDLNRRSERDKNIFVLGYRPTIEAVKKAYGGEWEEVKAPPPPPVNVEATSLPQTGRQPDTSGPPTEPSASPVFAESSTWAAPSPAKLDLPDQYATRAAIQAQPAIDGMLAAVQGMLNSAGSLAEARQLLDQHLPGMDPQALADILTQAILAAELGGRQEVCDGG